MLEIIGKVKREKGHQGQQARKSRLEGRNEKEANGSVWYDPSFQNYEWSNQWEFGKEMEECRDLCMFSSQFWPAIDILRQACDLASQAKPL